MVGKHIVIIVEGMCLIFDRHHVLLGAVECIPEFIPPHGAHRFALDMCVKILTSISKKSASKTYVEELVFKDPFRRSIPGGD